MLFKYDPILAAVLLGFLIDLILGDPRYFFHPVRLIGNTISLLEKTLRRIFPVDSKSERIAGTVLTVLVTGIYTAGSIAVLWLCYRTHFWLGFGVELLFCWQLIACRSLWKESMYVYRALEQPSLQRARFALSRIVGRDTENLDQDDIIRAAIETIAENTSDGVVAPLFYMMIFGAAGGFFYKSINTMDSMIGYKNRKYRHFGRTAARLDDAVNFLPARIAGLIMVLVSAGGGFDRRRAWIVFCRDRKNHPSPNSAHCEAAMAGALGVKLGGESSYGGKRSVKPGIGREKKTVQPDDIRRANHLMLRTSLASLLLFAAVRIIIFFVIRMAV